MKNISIINKPLPASFNRFQIKKGVGLMPDSDEDIRIDEQVELMKNTLCTCVRRTKEIKKM